MLRRGTVQSRYARHLACHQPHRDETTGKVMMGVKDQFLMDGGTHRQTTTLWWRTWRYLELTVETADEALTIECLGATFTAYPLKKESHLRAVGNWSKWRR